MDGSKLQGISNLADAVQTDGLSGFLTALPRMIGPGAQFFECVADADFCMSDAGSAEEFWDCARHLAVCMRDIKVDPEPPEPPDGSDGRWPQDVATLALAILFFQLRRDQGYTRVTDPPGTSKL